LEYLKDGITLPDKGVDWEILK